MLFAKRFLTLAVAATAVISSTDATSTHVDESEMLVLVTLSRHGSRAPNPTARKHCPNNIKNLQSYVVPPEQLTERGMQQLEATGRHIREVYIKEKNFLSSSMSGPNYTHFESYFRADSANRCGQSAISMGYGLYPDGTGPAGFAKQPIPVFMQLAENERDFTAGGPCWSMNQNHWNQYRDTRGKELIEKHMSSLKKIADICGTEFYTANDPIIAIKDVADMFLFDQDEGLPPTPGLTPELTYKISQLSFQHMIERLYTTPKETTINNAGFPELLLKNLNDAAATNRDPETVTKYFSYHGHRELIHGLGFMIGMKFNFEGLPTYDGSTPLIPGSTLFFELHVRKTKTTPQPSDYFVKVFVWSPKSERKQVKLEKCALDCPLSDFTGIIRSHIQATGSWQDICTYHPTNNLRPYLNAEAEVKPEASHIRSEAIATLDTAANKKETPETSQSMPLKTFFVPCFLLVGAGVVCVAMYTKLIRRRSYRKL